jgi:hypothetical protein
MVPTALVVKAHARHVKTRLVKDLKEIVQMDVLKTSRASRHKKMLFITLTIVS